MGENPNMVFKLALYAGGAFLAYKVGQKLGLFESDEEAAVDDARDQAIEDAINTGQSSTKTDAEWLLIADQIYADLRYSSLDDNPDDAGYQLARPKNDTDVYKLVKAFDKRTEYFFGLPVYTGPLPGWVTRNLSNEAINVINDNYLRKGIKFRW